MALPEGILVQGRKGWQEQVQLKNVRGLSRPLAHRCQQPNSVPLKRLMNYMMSYIMSTA